MPAEGPTVTQMMFLNDKEYSHTEKGKQKASRIHFPYSYRCTAVKSESYYNAHYS